MYEQKLTRLAQQHPDRLFVEIGYDEPLAHQIEAGSDLFLMPSRFEPCGLNQMYSLRYGTPPVVYKTGGLADTVIDANTATLDDASATGFVFDTPAWPPSWKPSTARSTSITSHAVAAPAAERHAPVVRLVGQCRPLPRALFPMTPAFTRPQRSHHASRSNDAPVASPQAVAEQQRGVRPGLRALPVLSSGPPAGSPPVYTIKPWPGRCATADVGLDEYLQVRDQPGKRAAITCRWNS